MAEHNFLTQGPKAYYDPKTGAYMTCHSKDELVRAKEAGFTSANYVRSEWPKQAFNKKTGDSKPVGKLGNTKEQNAAALELLGPDWTLDYVAAPEPVAPSKPGESTPDLSAMARTMADVQLLVKRIEELETAVSDGDGVRIALETRISELEGLLKS